MEELRSTEILEKEIISDARRKVERILHDADSECEKILASVDSRFQEIKNERITTNQRKVDDYVHNAEAAIPLEKQRRTVSFIDERVHLAVDEYFNNLSKDKKIKLISALLTKFKETLQKSCCEGASLEVVYHGFSKDEVSSTIKAVLGSSIKFDAKEEERLSDVELEGLLVKTSDNAVTCRVTLEELKNQLFTEYRFELQDALFQGRFNV